MAATGDQLPQQNPLAGMSDLTSLVNLFKGSSSSQTTSMNQAGMDAMLRNLLSGVQGLSAVSGGTKSMGGYNSTVQTQLTNDLMTRLAGQIAQGTATTTKSTKAPLGGTDILNVGLGLLAQKALAPTLKEGSKKLGLDKIGESLRDSIFGTSSAMPTGSLATGGFGDITAQSAMSGFDWGSVMGGAGEGIGAGLGMMDGVAGLAEGSSLLDVGMSGLGEGFGLDSIGGEMIGGGGGGGFFGDFFGGIGDILGSVFGGEGITAAMLEESPWLLAAL